MYMSVITEIVTKMTDKCSSGSFVSLDLGHKVYFPGCHSKRIQSDNINIVLLFQNAGFVAALN